VDSHTHRDLLCGGLADGTQTTFPMPVVVDSADGDDLVFVNGAIEDAVVRYFNANMLTDNMASFGTSVTGWDAWGTCSIARHTGISLDGVASCEVNPTLTQGDVGIQTNSSYRTSVSISTEYTVVVSIRGAGTFKIGTLFYDSVPAAIGTRSWTSGDTCTADSWTQLSKTVTSDGTADSLEITINRTTSSAENYYIDCVGLVNGDLVRWFLPSTSPNVIKFQSAPAEHARITATGTGNRLIRGRLQQSSVDWSHVGPGNARVGRLEFVEDIEV